MSETTAPQIPAGMVAVTKDEFIAALKADPRDIMPTTENREFTVWRVQSTRAVFGWSAPGWANPGAPKAWAVFKKAPA